MVFGGMMMFTILACLLAGVPLSIYLIQLPLVMALMFVFWLAWSVMLSPLSAISKDFGNLLKTLSTPFFWISGILFPLDALPRIGRIIMAFNPVSWCVESVRDCFVNDQWFWMQPKRFLPFLAVLLVVVILALHNYRRLYTEVPDVI